MKDLTWLVALACGLGIPIAAVANEPPAPWEPKCFVAALLGTTLAYVPNGGGFQGPQKDLTTILGVGRTVNASLAVELDLGLTTVDGSYSSASFVPGVIWTFHSIVYAAARIIVNLDPKPNLALAPGLGAIYVFANGLAPLVEANLVVNVGEGKPDLGIALTVGALYLY